MVCSVVKHTGGGKEHKKCGEKYETYGAPAGETREAGNSIGRNTGGIRVCLPTS